MAYNDDSARGQILNGRFGMKLPRTHQNCTEVYGVGRPGKTAVDKKRGHVAYKKNRRVWDEREKVWVKV